MEKLTSEVREFLLQDTRTGKLATIRADGRPHVVPIWFILDGDEPVFTTGQTSVKGQNIRRDARVSLCVDDENKPYAFAVVEGTATLSDNADELKKWATHIAARYMGAELAEEYGKRNGSVGELLVRLTPKKILFQKNLAG